MKVEVIREFYDKETGEKRSPGEVFDCTKERLAEIQTVSKRLVQVAEDDVIEEGEYDEQSSI